MSNILDYTCLNESSMEMPAQVNACDGWMISIITKELLDISNSVQKSSNNFCFSLAMQINTLELPM